MSEYDLTIVSRANVTLVISYLILVHPIIFKKCFKWTAPVWFYAIETIVIGSLLDSSEVGNTLKILREINLLLITYATIHLSFNTLLKLYKK